MQRPQAEITDNKTRRASVVSVRPVARDTYEVTIGFAEPFPFRSGQYVWVDIPGGVPEDPKGSRRAFSIANAPISGQRQIQILLRGGADGSAYRKTLLAQAPGSPLTVIGPFGAAFSRSGTTPLVMLSGGVGVSPFLSLMRETDAAHYLTGLYLMQYDLEADRTPYAEEIARYEGRGAARIRHEMFAAEHLRAAPRDGDTQYWISGPQGFVDHASKLLRAEGIAPERVRFESMYPTPAVRARLEKLLSESEISGASASGGYNRFVRTVLDRSSSHVVITDTNGVVLYANAAAERITGFRVSEMIGGTPRLWGSLMPAEFYANLWSTLVRQESFSGEITNRRKNGELYTVISHISPIAEGDEVLGYLATEEDISDLKRVDRAKTEFVSLASHQLRTPLSAVRWYAEMLLAGDAGALSPEQRKHVEEIYAGNARMIELVGALLDVSRIDLGTLDPQPERVAIVALLKDILKEQQFRIDEKRLALRLDVPEGDVIFRADPKHLRNIFQNLVSNAVKYTSEGGAVTVEIKLLPKGGGYHGRALECEALACTIADTGFGIPKSQQGEIFKKLFRADNAKERETDGNGLGLYIVKSLVESSGGEVWFESEEGKGTAFHIVLPAHTGDASPAPQ